MRTPCVVCTHFVSRRVGQDLSSPHGRRGPACTPPQCRQGLGSSAPRAWRAEAVSPRRVWRGGQGRQRLSLLLAGPGGAAGLAGVPAAGPPGARLDHRVLPGWSSQSPEPLNSHSTGVAQRVCHEVGPGGRSPWPVSLQWAFSRLVLRPPAHRHLLLTQQPTDTPPSGPG